MHGRPGAFGNAVSKVATKLQRPQPPSANAAPVASEPAPIYSLGRGGGVSSYAPDSFSSAATAPGENEQSEKTKRLPLNLTAKSARKAANKAGKAASSQATKMGSQATKMASSFARKLGGKKKEDGGQYQLPSADGSSGAPVGAAQVLGAAADEEEEDENSAMIFEKGHGNSSNDIECGQESRLLIKSTGTSPSSRPRSPQGSDRDVTTTDLSSSGCGGSYVDAHGTSGSDGERHSSRASSRRFDDDMWDSKAFGSVKPTQLGSIWDIPTSHCPKPEQVAAPQRTTAETKSATPERRSDETLPTSIGSDSYGNVPPVVADKNAWLFDATSRGTVKLFCLVLVAIAIALTAAQFI